MYRLLASGTMLGLFLQVVPITCLVGIVYAVIRYRHIKKRGCAVVWGTEIIVPVAIAIPVVIAALTWMMFSQILWVGGYGDHCCAFMFHYLVNTFAPGCLEQHGSINGSIYRGFI